MLSRKIVGVLIYILISNNAVAGDVLHFKNAKLQRGMERFSLESEGQEAQTRFQVVQFKNKISAKDIKAIKALGAQIHRYIPDDAVLIELKDLSHLSQIKTLAGINNVEAFTAELKLSSELQNVRGNTKVVVHTFGKNNLNSILQQISNREILKQDNNSFALELSPQSIHSLAQMEGVEWIQALPSLEFFDYDIKANLEVTAAIPLAAPTTVEQLTGFESGTKLMNFESAWNKGYTGKNQVVAYSDTGLDVGTTAGIHPDFTDAVMKGFAYGLFSTSWSDPMGHGTHVAGSILSRGNSSKGILKGGAFEAKLVVGGMWSTLINNLMPPQDATVMFKDAYQLGARVHSNSWGSSQNLGAYDAFAQKVDEFAWNNPEMLILFAAGNSGADKNKDGKIDVDSIGSPATAKNVLTVGASENITEGGINANWGKLKDQSGSPMFPTEPIASDKVSDNAKGIAAFSSRGPTDDGRIKPDIVSPGTNILSTKSHDKKAKDLWGPFNSDYTWCGGTSMATPLTAGAATVVRQYLMQTVKLNQPSASLLKAVMMHTATDLYPGQYGAIGKDKGQELNTTRPNVDEGFGLTNLDRATNLAGDYIVDEKLGVGDGSSKTFTVTASVPTELEVTMVYTDAPGSPSASKALVNDLDIQITQNGKVLRSGSDHLNNFENVKTMVQKGAIQITVKGSRVIQTRAQSKLPFALVATLKSNRK